MSFWSIKHSYVHQQFIKHSYLHQHFMSQHDTQCHDMHTMSCSHSYLDYPTVYVPAVSRFIPASAAAGFWGFPPTTFCQDTQTSRTYGECSGAKNITKASRRRHFFNFIGSIRTNRKRMVEFRTKPLNWTPNLNPDPNPNRTNRDHVLVLKSRACTLTREMSAMRV